MTSNGTLGTTTAFGTGINGQAFDFDGSTGSKFVVPIDMSPSKFPSLTGKAYFVLDISTKTQLLTVSFVALFLCPQSQWGCGSTFVVCVKTVREIGSYPMTTGDMIEQ